MSTTPLTMNVPDHEPTTIIETQYGMRFPDGTITWSVVEGARAGQKIYVKNIFDQHSDAVGSWDQVRNIAADRAKLDRGEYGNMHDIVKRTVVLAVTGIEEA